jgi:hypothetical protein
MAQNLGPVSVVVRDDDEALASCIGKLGFTFVMCPSEEVCAMVAVFRDLCGNLWDLIGPPVVDRGA